MEITKIEEAIWRIDELQKFAKTLNKLCGDGDQSIVIQMHKKLTPEQVEALQKGGRAGGIMEFITPDGKTHYEKAVARMTCDLDDIRSILGEFVSHSVMRSKEVYDKLRKEI